MCEMSDKLAEATEIVHLLQHHGHQAYFVGGYVRDKVWYDREDASDDIDIATSARPEEVMRIFPRAVATGLQHGTVTVVGKHLACEVTTFRTEEGYADHRRPDQVTFVDSLYEDLKRRDFTMNAMAMDVEGKLIDPFGGREDLANRVLRCVGDAQERFAEDGLRMLRCIRFAANYELHIEDETWQALLKQKALLKHIAVERQRIEMEKMMAGPAPHTGWQLLCESGLLCESQVAAYIPHEALCMAIDVGIGQLLGELEHEHLRWVLLLLASGMSLNDVRTLLRKLTFSKRQSGEVSRIIAFHEAVRLSHRSQVMDDLAQAWKMLCLQHSEPVALDWLWMLQVIDKHQEAKALLHLDQSQVDIYLRHGKCWLDEMPVRGLQDLHISGADIASLHDRPGPWIGELLQRLLIETALNQLANDKSTLIKRAQSIMGEVMMND